MSISLPVTSGQSIAPEYAATNISFIRSMVPVNGILTPTFTVNIAYSRQDYLLDAKGDKISVLSLTNTNTPMGFNPAYSGSISLTQDQLIQMSSAISSSLTTTSTTTPAPSLIDLIGNEADTLIHADLVARGILAS